MHSKDFNKLTIDGTTFVKKELLAKAQRTSYKETWEADFWNFISNFMDHSDHVTVKSSGSTGEAKLIKLSKNRMFESAKMTCHYLNLKKGNKALLCLSTKHIGGMMMVVRAIYAELNLILVPPSSNPLEFIKEEIDFAAMVPYQVAQTMETKPESLQLIKALIIGGGKVNKNLSSKIVALKINAFSTFGMTETISHIALQKIGENTSYHCLENIKVKLSKKATLEIDAPKLSDTSILTNDLVQIISPKEFIWLGRADFAIETGGIKVLPELIEQKLEESIATRFIISSIPDDKLNNQVVLILEGDYIDIQESIFSKLEKYEKPKKVFFIKKMAEIANNKLNRIKIREQVLLEIK